MDMRIRKIIRDFVSWQIEKDMLNECVIDYEVAETYLEEKKIKLWDLYFVSKVKRAFCRHDWQMIYEGIYECSKCKKQKCL